MGKKPDPNRKYRYMKGKRFEEIRLLENLTLKNLMQQELLMMNMTIL